MTLFIISCIAGILTTLAPCTLPLLPVIIGGSVAEGVSGRKKAITVIASLGVSLIVFTFLLKVSSAFIMVPPQVWAYLSGGIILAIGFSFLFPDLWAQMPGVSKLSRAGNRSLAVGYGKKTIWGDVLIGLSLGPVFSSCSPTYFIILATVLPASLPLGILYLGGYVAGLCLTLLLISLLGQRIMGLLGVASNPRGWFKRILGTLFVLVGIAILFGVDIRVEQFLSTRIFDVTTVEQALLQKAH